MLQVPGVCNTRVHTITRTLAHNPTHTLTRTQFLSRPSLPHKRIHNPMRKHISALHIHTQMHTQSYATRFHTFHPPPPAYNLIHNLTHTLTRTHISTPPPHKLTQFHAHIHAYAHVYPHSQHTQAYIQSYTHTNA